MTGMKVVHRRLMTYLIVDVASLAHRQAHALSYLSTSDGRMSGHVFGSIKGLASVVRDFTPEVVVFAYEGGGSGWRRKILDKYPLDGKAVADGEGYKRNRESGKDDLPVVDFLQDVERAFLTLPGLHLRVQGFEADDMIAAFVKTRDKGVGDGSIAIFSGDKDLWQLVNDKDKVFALYPKREKGRSSLTIMREADVQKDIGVPPSAISRIKALLGDNSDNVVGVLEASRPGKSKGCQAVALSADTNYFDRKIKARADVVLPEGTPDWLAKQLKKQRRRLLANYRVCSLPYAVKKISKQLNSDALPALAVSSELRHFKAFQDVLSEFECRALLASSKQTYELFGNPPTEAT